MGLFLSVIGLELRAFIEAGALLSNGNIRNHCTVKINFKQGAFFGCDDELKLLYDRL